MRGRQAGKTEALIAWVRDGEETVTYPYWSRVIVTAGGEKEAKRLRISYDLEYRQVFSLTEWAGGHVYRSGVEVAIDDVQHALAALYGDVVLVTATGEIAS